MLASKPSSAGRRNELDWLRVLAFGLLIFYHTGMFFVSWEWHIKNNLLSEAMEWPMQFMSQWRMSLLFMISGAAVYFMLPRQSAAAFAGNRVKRILLPLVAGMLLVVPPQIYFERLTQGHSFSYLQFYPTIFDFNPYPAGNFSWHHLWYLVYIFVYSLICLPVFKYLQSDSGKAWAAKTAALLSRPVVLLLIPGLWLGIGDALLRPHWDTTNDLIHDWASHFQYLTLFLIGFLCVTQQTFAEAVRRCRYVSLGLGTVSIVLLFRYWLNWHDLPPAEMTLYWLLKSFNRWWWLLTLLGFARHHLNFSNRGLSYANEAVYPFYILHQTVIICIAYPMINWSLPVGVKFLIISLGTVLICWLLYEGIIRRTGLLRPLFGLKEVSQKQPEKARQAV
jgi:hypothetical protein